jgi:hypothetical protein
MDGTFCCIAKAREGGGGGREGGWYRREVLEVEVEVEET